MIIWSAAIGIAILLANTVAFLGWTYPAWKERSASQRLHGAAEMGLHNVRQDLRALEVLGRGALDAGDGLRALLDDRLLENSELPTVMEHLRKAAESAGVRLERVDHREEAVEELGSIRLEMAAFGAGSYAAIRGWIAGLRGAPGLSWVDRVEMSGTDGGLLAVQLTAVALLRAPAAAEAMP